MATFDLSSIFNILFFGLLGLGLFFGFVRGFKKSLYGLIVMLIFYTFFFITIDLVVDFLWKVKIPGLGGILSQIQLELANASSLETAFKDGLNNAMAEDMSELLSNKEFMSFATAMAKFVLKIIYAIIYFTIFSLIYKFLAFLFRVIFLRSKKDKDKSKQRLLGALCGTLKASLSVYFLIIIFGGAVSMAESADKFLPEDQKITELNQFIDGFNKNIIVKAASFITITDDKLPVHNYLYDKVFSIDYSYTIKSEPEVVSLETNQGLIQLSRKIPIAESKPTTYEVKISIRKEIAIAGEIYDAYLNSDYYRTQNLSDIKGDEIRNIFKIFSKSDIIQTVIPLGIEVASEQYDTEVDVPRDELYSIDWEDELSVLGEIAAQTFDLLNTAGIFDEDGENNFEEVNFTGEEIRGLFDSLSESKLVTLSAYVALAPILKEAGNEVNAIISVPEDLDWSNEFKAIGSIAGEIVESGITVKDIQSGNPSTIVSKLSNIEFTVILNSKIVKNALINIFSGKANIPGFDMFTVPDDIDWDVELENVLIAVKAIASKAANIDFANITPKIISEFDTETINKIFGSLVLRATISNLISSMDIGSTPVILSKNVFDEQDYLKQEELTNLVASLKTMIIALPCDEDDESCNAVGFDINKILGISDDDINILLNSLIISDTIGNFIMTQTNEYLVIPLIATEEIIVKDEARKVVSDSEIRKLLKGVTTLGIQDIENIKFDASILQNLSVTNSEGKKVLDEAKKERLFASDIVHASLSKMLIDFIDDENQIIVVPYKDVTGANIRYIENENNYINKVELEAILEGVIALNLDNFEDVDGLGTNTLIENIDILLDSAIFHATLSKQILDLEKQDLFIIPMKDFTETKEIRIIVGEQDNSTEFIIKSEIESVVETLKILEITDIKNFDGKVNLNNLINNQDNQDKVLDSASLHATISKQIIKLDTDNTIIVPKNDSSGKLIRRVNHESNRSLEFVVKTEIQAIIDSLGVLGITDIETYDGKVNLNNLINNPTNQNTLLSSAILHATVSKQITNLDTNDSIIVPQKDSENKPIRMKVSEESREFEFISKAEIQAIIDSLGVLGITDIETYDGKVNLNNLINKPTNQNTLLSSAILHATVSKQITNLDTNDSIIVPQKDSENKPIRMRVTEENREFEFINKNEIYSIIDSLGILGINDISTFSGTVTLTNLYNNETNQNKILASAIIHATVSNQLFNLDTDNAIVVPSVDTDNEIIRIIINDEFNSINYISKLEIKSLINILEILGVEDVTKFSGKVNLNDFYDNDNNQNLLLKSATIHATISRQMIDIGADKLTIPTIDFDGIEVKSNLLSYDFVSKKEIKDLINALKVLGVSDVTNFDGTFTLELLKTSENQDKLLKSASIHASISRELFDLHNSGVIVVPKYTQDGIAEQYLVQKTLSLTNFVYKTEIKAIIDAFIEMGYQDLDSFGESISSTKFFDNRELLLKSAIIQATISDMMINDTNGKLIIPNININNRNSLVRIDIIIDENLDVTYIDIDEIRAILDALEELELTDFSNIDMKPDNVFKVDFNILLKSASVHATLSDIILDNSFREEDPSYEGHTLIVPSYFRVPNVQVGTETTELIEVDELEAILNALQKLAVSNFDGAMNAGIITYMDDTTLDALLASGSIHVTIDNMLNGNTYINSMIPALAVEEDSLYGISDLTKKTEIKAFIKAASKVISPDDETANFTNAEFKLDTIANMNEDDVDIILDSMIVRNTITIQIKSFNDSLPFPVVTFDDEDYENDDQSTFLKEEAIIEKINTLKIFL